MNECVLCPPLCREQQTSCNYCRKALIRPSPAPGQGPSLGCGGDVGSPWPNSDSPPQLPPHCRHRTPGLRPWVGFGFWFGLVFFFLQTLNIYCISHKNKLCFYGKLWVETLFKKKKTKNKRTKKRNRNDGFLPVAAVWSRLTQRGHERCHQTWGRGCAGAAAQDRDVVPMAPGRSWR